jgi:hypothetical protein
MTNSKPKPMVMSRRQTLITLFFGGILAYVLWNTPSLSFLTYPLRLFVTYIHEASHSLAAIITGGQVLQFTVSPDGSGLATTMGGSRLLILPAGYLGAALFGSGLFYLLYRHPHPRTYSAVIGAFLVIFTALYARPDASGAWTAMVVGILFGLILIAMAWKATPHLTQLLLTILALITATNAILDINSLTRMGGDCNGDTITDAVQMACSFGLSSGFWAIVWMGVAVIMLGASVYFSVARPFLQKIPARPAKKSADEVIKPSPTPKPTPTPRRPVGGNDKPPAKTDDPLKNLKRDDDGEIDFSQFNK